MRRPLFGNGIPKLVTLADGPQTIFDTVPFTPDAGAPPTYSVTVFAWWDANIGVARPSFGFSVDTDGSSGAASPAVAGYTATYLAALEAQLTPQQAVPLKVIDRLMLRGNQQLRFQTDANVHLFGYFEGVGDAAVPGTFRPLQPNNTLVEPFSAPPTLVFPAGPNANEYKTAHMLSNKYIDSLVLQVDFVKTAVYGSYPKAFVRLPGGIKLPLPAPLPAADAIANGIIVPFDGIPMRAPSASANLVEVGFDDSDNAGSSALSAYGSFYRY